jgi:acetyl-CoA carboxylase biotin carboxyl carrier protein
MSTSDQNQSQPHGGEQGSATGTAATQQSEPGANAERGSRHGRRRHGRTERRGEQRQTSQRRGGEATLNMEELRELTELFSTHGLTDFEFENADIRIRLSRNPAPVLAAVPGVAPAQALTPLDSMQTAATHAASAVQTQGATPVEGSTAATQAPAAPETPEEDLHIITSPIVGTFYRSPSPTAEPFVKVGSRVEADTVVCIIEAMKLMNEIQAETSGEVARMYVENGQPVEYGQPLFGLKK